MEQHQQPQYYTVMIPKQGDSRMKYKAAKRFLVMAILFYLASIIAIGTTTTQTVYAARGNTDTLTMTVNFHPATSGIAGFFFIL